MPARKLQIATCQFPVSGDVRANARYIRRQMTAAARHLAEDLGNTQWSQTFGPVSRVPFT